MMSHHRTKIVIGACGFVAAAILVFVAAGPSPWVDATPAPAAAPEAKKSTPDLVADVSRGIVRVTVWRMYQVKDDKSGKELAGCSWGTGTGFVIRCERLGGDDTTDDIEFDFVTNNHVLVLEGQQDWVAPAKLLCTVWGVETTNAAILGRDVAADLAAVRVRARADKNELPRVLPWADPSGVRIGDDVLAIGFARDLRGRPTVTRGIISATRRGEPTSGSVQALFTDLIQLDACINHGNSGGPLLNIRRRSCGREYLLDPPRGHQRRQGQRQR